MKKNLKDYPVNDPKFAAYHNQIDRLMQQSQILNGGGMINSTSRIWDKTGITTELLILKGNANGEFNKHNNLCPSNIKICKSELFEIEQKFISYCERLKREGKRAPDSMPQNILDEKLKILGRLFVYESEMAALEEKLKPFLIEEKTISDRNVLQRGPIGSSTLSGGRVSMIDGQKVALSQDGEPMIMDERSPYNGMKTGDYFEFIVKPWGFARAKKAKENLMDAQAKGIGIDEMKKGNRIGANVAWPKIPENYLKKEEVETETTVTRLKR